MKTRTKKAKDENFPVAFFLLPKDFRRQVMDYYNFARQADDIADNPKLSQAEKLKQLHEMEAILFGRPYRGKKFQSAFRLREMFLKNNFSFSLASDLLIAFRRDAKNFKYETWAQLIDYCRYSAAPVGIFMLALYNENPSTYLPASTLCTALQLVNHIQDCGYDAKMLKRVYIPENLRHKYKLSSSDLMKKSVCPALRKAADEILEKTEELLKEAEILPRIVKSTVLRIEIYVIIYLTKIMIYKLKKRDFLAERIELSRTDRIVSLIKGIAMGLAARRRTLSTKGL